MSEPDRLLPQVVGALERLKIPYMVTGSLASGRHGLGRSTFDIDIVIDPSSDQLDELVKSLKTDFYVSESAAREAAQSRGMFNIIDPVSGSKVDFIVRKDRPFSVMELSRRSPANFDGVHAYVSSAEDVILSKLEWAELGQSERQISDAASIIEVQRDSLDFDYLRHWAAELGVSDALHRLLTRVT